MNTLLLSGLITIRRRQMRDWAKEFRIAKKFADDLGMQLCIGIAARWRDRALAAEAAYRSGISRNGILSGSPTDGASICPPAAATAGIVVPGIATTRVPDRAEGGRQ